MLLILMLILIIAATAIAVYLFFLYGEFYNKKDIKVGVLFSETGTMADSEKPVINAVLLAIDQINAKGGINKRKIRPIFYDGESNWLRYAQLAKKLILNDEVITIFGCWTSASRKEVKPIVEKYENLLIYPTQYEGAEESRNIIYLGATPNQQVVPAVSWAFQKLGKRAYLVGSDYIFPHTENQVISHEVSSRGGEIVGTKYIPLGSKDVDHVIKDIIEKNPDVIFNTINGDTNVAFFNRLYEMTKEHRRPVVISFSTSTAEMNQIEAKRIQGDYAMWSYFIQQEIPENLEFLKAYREKYGSAEGLNDPAATAYAGVFMWKQALEIANTDRPAVIRDFMIRQSTASPSGVIYIDPNSNAWRVVSIGEINEDGKLTMVWTSQNPIKPIIYPSFKTKTEWDLFEFELYMKWNKSWENIES